MEQRNEPSTAEIVVALHGFFDKRGFAKDASCALIAADRLEQLERENAGLRGKIDLQSRICKVCEQKLTARAEQAERERDAAVNALTLYEDALFDECDKSYQSGFMDGFQSREEIDDED